MNTELLFTHVLLKGVRPFERSKIYIFYCSNRYFVLSETYMKFFSKIRRCFWVITIFVLNNIANKCQFYRFKPYPPRWHDWHLADWAKLLLDRTHHIEKDTYIIYRLDIILQFYFIQTFFQWALNSYSQQCEISIVSYS